MMVNRLFGRVTEVISGNVKMNNADLDIYFDIPFDDDLNPNLSEVRVFNLSKDTINQLKQGQKLNLNAGYKDDKGLILNGTIASVSSSRTGADKETLIKVLDSASYNATKSAQKTYKKGIKADVIIKDLAKLIGLKIAVLKLPKNKVYQKGHSFNGGILKELQTVAVDCGASCYISRGQVYIRSIKEGENHNFVLNADTGLIGSPEYFEKEENGRTIKGYKCKSLLQYRLHTASIVRVQSRDINVLLRVRSGKHTSNGNSYYTEFEGLL